jgi:hypothetical protein
MQNLDIRSRFVSSAAAAPRSPAMAATASSFSRLILRRGLLP